MQFAQARQDGAARPTLPLELILADGSKYPEPGRFFFADRQVDIKTGTIQVAVLFPNPGNLLRPGQYAKVRAAVQHRENALLIPQRAVADLQGKSMVGVVNPDNRVSLRAVKTAETLGPLWVVEAGLKPGERVIVEGLQKVREGVQVQPKPYAAPAAPDEGS